MQIVLSAIAKLDPVSYPTAPCISIGMAEGKLKRQVRFDGIVILLCKQSRV